ncbi:MAG: hypothetical protein ABFE08_09885 [Armatimonadia bacterium]
MKRTLLLAYVLCAVQHCLFAQVYVPTPGFEAKAEREAASIRAPLDSFVSEYVKPQFEAGIPIMQTIIGEGKAGTAEGYTAIATQTQAWYGIELQAWKLFCAPATTKNSLMVGMPTFYVWMATREMTNCWAYNLQAGATQTTGQIRFSGGNVDEARTTFPKLAQSCVEAFGTLMDKAGYPGY